MLRIIRTIGTATSALIGILLLAASAQAGVWEVTYDLAPGSSVTTTTPLGPDVDPMTGTFVVEYDAASTAAPLTGARLKSGAFHVTLSNMVTGILTITGSTDTTLLPASGGTPGVLSGDTLILDPVPDSSSTGFIHCYNAGCVLAGLTASVMVPQTPTGPGPFPITINGWVFTSGTAGVGDWAAPTNTIVTQTPMGITVTVQQDYVGREISRVFLPEPTTGAGMASGALLLGLLYRLRGRRRSQA